MSRYTSNRAKLRLSLFKMQDGKCWLCGGPMQMRKSGQTHGGPHYATFNHVTPRSMGGKNGAGNLKLAHRQCNGQRGSRFDPNRVTVSETSPP